MRVAVSISVLLVGLLSPWWAFALIVAGIAAGFVLACVVLSQGEM